MYLLNHGFQIEDNIRFFTKPVSIEGIHEVLVLGLLWGRCLFEEVLEF